MWRSTRWGGLAVLLVLGCLTAGCSSKPASRAEEATPRGLTAAVLHHLDAAEAARIGGSSQYGIVWSFIQLNDEANTNLFVSALRPGDDAAHVATCSSDSGFTIVTCERSDGELLEIARGPKKSANGNLALLIGRIVRADGSLTRIEIHAQGVVEFPGELAEQVLTDPAVGWMTTAAINDEGERLPDFHDDPYFDTLTGNLPLS